MQAVGLAKRKSGFTLVELSLSITFISVLSIIVVVLMSGTISSYRRGLTLNAINTGGMDLVDELRTTMQNSKGGSTLEECKIYKDGESDPSGCIEDGGKNFASIVRYADIGREGSDPMSKVPAYGALCTGRYSYVWNSGYFSDENGYAIKDGGSTLEPASIKYKMGDSVKTYPDVGDDGSNEAGRPLRLVKVEDRGREVCLSQMKKKEYGIEWKDGGVFDISDGAELKKDPEEILPSDGSNDLAVYFLDTAIPAESKSSEDVFYSVSLILGTINGGIDLSQSGDFCATPDQALENMDFCAVNKFNFAIKVNGVNNE